MEDTLDILVRKFVEISVAILSRRLIEDTPAILIQKFVEVSLEVAILDGKSDEHRSKIPSPFLVEDRWKNIRHFDPKIRENFRRHL